MSRRLSVLALLLLFGSGSISASSFHVDGEAGCAMSCCKEARESGARSLLPQLCCKLECKQPGGTQTSSATDQFSRSAPPLTSGSNLNPGSQTDVYLNQSHFAHSPSRQVAGSNRRFLETGALLI